MWNAFGVNESAFLLLFVCFVFGVKECFFLFFLFVCAHTENTRECVSLNAITNHSRTVFAWESFWRVRQIILSGVRA